MIKSALKILLAVVISQNYAYAQKAPLTVGDIQKQFPGTKIKQVSLAEYERYVAQANNPCSAYQGAARNEGNSNFHDSSEPMPSFNFSSYSSGSSDKNFLVIVAVIGVIVVAALVVYSVGYLVEMANSGFQCRAWSDFGFRYSYVSDSTSTQVRYGNMEGIYYSLGYVVPFGVMGLTAELGGHSLHLNINQAGIGKDYSGAYLLAGPSFSFPFEKFGGHAFQIELLAGTSTDNNIGLMSTLRFGLDLKVNPQVSLGINFGAALINLKDFDNYLKDNDHLNFLSGASMSYRW